MEDFFVAIFLIIAWVLIASLTLEDKNKGVKK
jgi:hypothetical protein